MRQTIIRIVLAWLVLTGARTVAGHPGDHAVSMWEVQGQQNTVYLLGSIHLLREQDYPLPGQIYAAYRDADALYMELDMDDADPLADAALANKLGLIEGDKSLRDLLGPTVYAQAEDLAEAAQIPLQLLDRAEPWFASVQIELMVLLRMGFNPSFGVEMHLLEMSRDDGKEILGLETVQQQLSFLDELSAKAQREMLIQALADSSELPQKMNGLISAWHSGDAAFLEKNLLTEMQEHAELNKVIVDDRNLNWAEQIDDLLDDERNYLVVVGALHLVGANGVPTLLEKRGYSVSQVNGSTQ